MLLWLKGKSGDSLGFAGLYGTVMGGPSGDTFTARMGATKTCAIRSTATGRVRASTRMATIQVTPDGFAVCVASKHVEAGPRSLIISNEKFFLVETHARFMSSGPITNFEVHGPHSY
jgi:hypothetical protein